MNIYQEKLLDHYHDPKNYGKLDDFKAQALMENRSCGDAIEMFIDVEKNTIINISFQGEGCSVAIATASMLTEFVKGKELDEVLKITMDDVLDLLGIELTLSRLRCAGVALDSLKKAVANYLDQG
jgi:nitrogen fixation NifU-like protein